MTANDDTCLGARQPRRRPRLLSDGWGDGTCGDGNGNGSGTLYTRGDGYGAAYDNGNGYSGGGASDGSSGKADDIQVNYSDSRWRPS